MFYINTIITSKREILETSRTLLKEKGASAISIRSVASACGISVGSVYNYFDSKSDLVAATIESVWFDIFHFPEQGDSFTDILSCIDWLYKSMEDGAHAYPDFFSLHSMSFMEEEKSKGRKLMQKAWTHIQDRLCTIIQNDKNVCPDAFNNQFTLERFSALLFSLIFSSLLRQDYNSSAVTELVRRCIYISYS